MTHASRSGFPRTGIEGTGSDLPYKQLQRIARAAVRRVFERAGRRDEDLVQEVLTRVLRSLADGRFAGRCSLSAWVWAIARNVVADELRTVARDAKVGSIFTERAEAAATIDVERQLEARSTLLRVQYVLDRMDPVSADILRLHDLLGHGLVEVAARTKLSVAAAQSRLVRARRSLLDQLDVQIDRTSHTPVS